MGVVLEAKYPDDITAGLVDDDLLTIFSTHAMTEQAGILSMRIKRFSIVSYYTGIPESEGESQYFVALVLNDNENPNTFEESLTEIAKMIIDSIDKPGFDDFYVECFDRVSKMKEITEEQRYAFIFRDDVRSLMLTKLTDGAMTKEGLAKWLSKEVEREVTDIDGLLAPLMKTELVTELNISKGKKVSLEYVFLLRDVAIIRTPHVEVFKAAKEGQMDPHLREKYQAAVEKFFKKYRISTEDSQTIAELISNPDTYDVIKVLREGYMTREEIPAKIGREMPNLDRNLKKLAEEDIILPTKDKKQRVWIFLLSNIQAITFFPEYMVDVIRRRWREGTIAKEIALKHLELLRAEYIATQAPKYRKKIFESIETNFENAQDNIKKGKLDQAASNLEVCSTQSFDMGERKLGGEITNAAKLLREDKDKYIEEQWEKDKAKILEMMENIRNAIDQEVEKKPKKKKELDIKEKGKGPSEKAEELEKGKGKEEAKKKAIAKEKFSLGASVDEAGKAPKAAPPSTETKAPPTAEKKPPTKTPAKKEPAKKEEAKDKGKAKEKDKAKNVKSQISALEKEIKKLKKSDDLVKAAEKLGELAAIYKESGDLKKAQAAYDDQNKLTITALKSLQSDLVKQAKEAESKKDWKKAAESWSQAKEISSNLFKAGVMDQADKVKEFTANEKKCTSQVGQ